MKKYTTFPMSGNNYITILTASIIGFEQPDSRIAFTNIVLENGARLPVSGLDARKAREIYEESLPKAGSQHIS